MARELDLDRVGLAIAVREQRYSMEAGGFRKLLELQGGCCACCGDDLAIDLKAVGHSLAMRGAVKVGVAGGSAERKYADLTKAWRREMRSRFLLMALVLAPVVGLLVFVGIKWDGQLRWSSGFLVGCVFALFVILRMSPPAWIENWQDGAIGEQWTAKSLRPLEARGWVVLHDLPGDRGNLDHVVVGPGGVFLLDSKRWRGSTAVNGDVATVHRVEDPDLSYRFGGVGHLKGLAFDVHDRLRTESGLNRWVAPVVVIWGAFPQRVAGETCKFVHGEELANWLEQQPKSNRRQSCGSGGIGNRPRVDRRSEDRPRVREVLTLPRAEHACLDGTLEINPPSRLSNTSSIT